MSIMLEALRLRQLLPTWPPYEGHPNDPRADDGPAHAGTILAIEDVISSLRRARDDVRRTDEWTKTAADLVRDAIESLLALEVEP